MVVSPSISELIDYKTSYDVSGMIIMAGGIDIHSHIAGGSITIMRVLSPEIPQFLDKTNRKKSLPGFNMMDLQEQVIGMRRWVLRQL